MGTDARDLEMVTGANIARALGPLFLIGPIVGLGAVLVAQPDQADWRVISVIVLVAWLLGLAMITGRFDSLTPTFFLGASFVGNVLLSVAIYFSNNTDMGAAFLYLWQVPFAVHYFRLRHAVVLLAFSTICFGVVLMAQQAAGVAPLRIGRWVSLVGTELLLGVTFYQLSQRLQDYGRRFHSIFQHGPLGMALVDSQRNVVEINPALERLAGRAAAQLIGYSFAHYIHPDDLAAVRNALATPDADGHEQAQAEVRIVQPDGSTRDTMLTVSAIRGTRAELAGYVGIIEDLTERRRAERAEAENQAKSRFLALMSHELRTPLNAVLGFSQLLERRDFGPLNDRQTRYVSNIRTAGQHLLTLVNDLLDFSKVSADRMDFHGEVVDVEALVDEALANVRLSADEKSLSLEQSVESGLTVYADKFRLRQVLLNLLSNGVKFTNAGGVSVKARAEGEKTCIEVTDTGVGIPSAMLPRLFSEFSQIDSSITRTQQGTGLGLALSKQLVVGMGGSIKVTSREGEGSTFTVLMPRAEPPPA